MEELDPKGKHDSVSVNMDQSLIKAVCRWRMSSLYQKTSAGLGLQMAAMGVEKFVVRDMIPTMVGNLGFMD